MSSKFKDSKLFSYTDIQIIAFLHSLPSLEGYSNIIPLSSRYLAKGYLEDELADALRSLELAVTLEIRAPKVRRVVRTGDAFYCVMDRIPGATLDTKWPKLGWFTSLQLAFQLRRIVCRLRSIDSASCGSLATGNCRSYYLEDSFGLPPRATSTHVNAFLNFWANLSTPRKETRKTSVEHSVCPRHIFSSNRPFVFTHHDLAPRNLIIDDNKQLWLIDWDDAGFYPRSFEYAGMHNFIPTGWSRFTLWRWRLLSWIAGGLYNREARWLEIIRSRFTRFRSVRRFNIKANGYAAATGRPDEEVN